MLNRRRASVNIEALRFFGCRDGEFGVARQKARLHLADPMPAREDHRSRLQRLLELSLVERLTGE